MIYIPKEYWQERGKNYEADSDDSIELLSLANFIRTYSKISDTYLEVGSGYGRVYKYLRQYNLVFWDKYLMADFAKSMMDRCYSETGNKPILWDGKTLPMSNNSFDWVVSFDVFLHVPPDDLCDVFAEHVRVCRKYMFIATYMGSQNERLSSHCFSHNYKELFKKFNISRVAVRAYVGGRVNYLMEKEER